MKGYKAFNKDLKCKGFQFEVGKEYLVEGKLEICKNGFHFCETIADCYKFYPKENETRICEIETLGEVVKDDNKYCTSKIRIVRELTKEEHNNGNIGSDNLGFGNKGSFNEGNDNEGDGNKGDGNKGNYNEGDYNKGDYNEGDGNKGDYNKGDSNEGDSNEGDSNEGDGNKGDYNKGDYNEGNFNIGIKNQGNYQVGICNTNAPLVIFNKVSKMTFKELFESGALDDIANGNLTDAVRSIDTFDIDVWNEIFGDSYETKI